MAEGYVGLSPDSSGQKARVNVIPVGEPDGTTQTVDMQVVVLDEEDRQLLRQTLLTLRMMVGAQILLLRNAGVSCSADDLLQLTNDF